MNEGQEREDKHFTEEEARMIWQLANDLQAQGLKDMSTHNHAFVMIFGQRSEDHQRWKQEGRTEFRRLQSIKEKANRIINSGEDEQW